MAYQLIARRYICESIYRCVLCAKHYLYISLCDNRYFYGDPWVGVAKVWTVNCGSQRLFASKVHLFYLLRLNRRMVFGFAVRGGRSSLRQTARGQKVADPIPDGIIGIFLWVNPSGHTQPLTELSRPGMSYGA